MNISPHDPSDPTGLRCRLCGGGRLFSVLDLGATPPCEKFLCADELDQPEITYRCICGCARSASCSRSPH